MSSLTNKIDFAVIFRVTKANPNGDPLNGNRPRTDYEGYGEVTDVCLKRKIRDRLSEKGYKIFVQAEDRKVDSAKHLKERAELALGKNLGAPDTVTKACQEWLDVRAFGQLFAFKSSGKKGKKADTSDEKTSDAGVSVPIRGPVSVHSAFSIEPVNITSTQITKSVSGDEGKDGNRSSDTMGMKHRVDQAVYVFYGSMSPQLAERTGFTNEDAKAIKEVLPRLFENDASSARPDGSMAILNVFWWQHNSKAGQYSSAKTHATLIVNPDGTYTLNNLNGLIPEIIDGF